MQRSSSQPSGCKEISRRSVKAPGVGRAPIPRVIIAAGQQKQNRALQKDQAAPLQRQAPRTTLLDTAAQQRQTEALCDKRTYTDGPFGKLAIGFINRQLSKELGVQHKPGYDGFVQLTRRLQQKHSTEQQQQAILGILYGLIPSFVPPIFRRLFPLSQRWAPPLMQWGAELNAAITVRFFGWLVGPLETQVIDVDVDGRVQTWRSGVKIEKCRFLEQSECKGTCVNMCKVPTQTLFTERLGMPLTMAPNFEDLSCEMRFGQRPPASLQADEVYAEPCFHKVCRETRRDPALPCLKIDSDRRMSDSC